MTDSDSPRLLGRLGGTVSGRAWAMRTRDASGPEPERTGKAWEEKMSREAEPLSAALREQHSLEVALREQEDRLRRAIRKGQQRKAEGKSGNKATLNANRAQSETEKAPDRRAGCRDRSTAKRTKGEGCMKEEIEHRQMEAIKLRAAARDGDGLAKAELRRRVGNLKGALIPEWEIRMRPNLLAQIWSAAAA